MITCIGIYGTTPTITAHVVYEDVEYLKSEVTILTDVHLRTDLEYDGSLDILENLEIDVSNTKKNIQDT